MNSSQEWHCKAFSVAILGKGVVTWCMHHVYGALTSDALSNRNVYQFFRKVLPTARDLVISWGVDTAGFYEKVNREHRCSTAALLGIVCRLSQPLNRGRELATYSKLVHKLWDALGQSTYNDVTLLGIQAAPNHTMMPEALVLLNQNK